ncbi:YxcD family protein [Metasolibacillus sp.]|uniref:YxcD family protein n=1 Tax=Metasolibacillus sp. TaxID=2703680 RepID=UPI0025DF6CBA|nr:YxcD family protein [Metasolibacillus sp.]MCT6925252.1 YxcD family protein [Metasolibacillus sp.]MCT6941518.1 YxcD family protein [Metasolibacillus sp.]
MEQLTLFEQDLINAICIFHARFKNVQPENVEVELMYDDLAGYTAEAYVNGQVELYNTVNFITALRLYIDEELQRDSISARISLDIDDEAGMIANVSW